MKALDLRAHGIVPCPDCTYLVRDNAALLGLRCLKGDAADMCGDFSCYAPRRYGTIAEKDWPPAWVPWA